MSSLKEASRRKPVETRLKSRPKREAANIPVGGFCSWDAVLLWGWVPRWGQSLTGSIVSLNGCESPQDSGQTNYACRRRTISAPFRPAVEPILASIYIDSETCTVNQSASGCLSQFDRHETPGKLTSGKPACDRISDIAWNSQMEEWAHLALQRPRSSTGRPRGDTGQSGLSALSLAE